MEAKSIAKNLIYQRKLKGFSQEQLSHISNVTIRSIQRIEKNEVSPHLKTVKLLADALEIEVEDLLELLNPREENIQKKWLLLLHATPIFGLVIPLCNILFPLFLWIHKREDNPIYNRHGRAIVNFQITMTILMLASLITLVTVEKYGFLFFIIVIPFTIIVSIVNLVWAMNSQKCYFPLAIPFIKKLKNHTGNRILIICCLFSFYACTNSLNQVVHRLDGSTIEKDSLTIKIERLIENANIHGISISVFNNNQIAYFKNFGFRDHEKKLPLKETTNFYGASFSKVVFSTLVMKLVEENVIDLDTPLESYLPKPIHSYKPRTKWHDNYSDLKNDSLYNKITARMCLSHTSGFPNWRWFEEDQKLKVKFKPGSKYHYSGEGQVFLQVVLEKITNRGINELAKEKIFVPLKMENTSFKWEDRFENNFANGHQANGKLYIKDKDNEPRGPSTLETTSKDFNLFITAVLNQEILSKETWNEIFAPQVKIRSITQFGELSKRDSTLNDAIELSYGLGWGLLKTPYGIGAFKEGHGNGFQHYSILFPEAKKGIVIMTNSDNGESIFKELLEVAIKDVYTPWKWQNYIPYEIIKKRP